PLSIQQGQDLYRGRIAPMPLQADQQPRAFCLFLRLKERTQVSIGQVVSVLAGKLDAGENTNGEAVKNVAFTLLACLVPIAAASRAKPRRLLARKGGRAARGERSRSQILSSL